MTQLLQWLGGVGAFTALWTAFVTKWISVDIPDNCMEVMYYLPIYLLMSFACYSLAAVGYRVATFNDCKQAAEELKHEIEDARKDLKRKGFTFS